MRALQIVIFIALSVQGASASAQTQKPLPVPATRQLEGLTADEATALIGKVEDAQRRLKAGEPQSFELLAGSITSYHEITISPRDAFLKMPLKQVWNITRAKTDNRAWQPFRLAYSPNGLGRPYWDIEVVLGFYGDIQRIMMIYKPPAPF